MADDCRGSTIDGPKLLYFIDPLRADADQDVGPGAVDDQLGILFEGRRQDPDGHPALCLPGSASSDKRPVQ